MFINKLHIGWRMDAINRPTCSPCSSGLSSVTGYTARRANLCETLPPDSLMLRVGHVGMAFLCIARAAVTRMVTAFETARLLSSVTGCKTALDDGG